MEKTLNPTIIPAMSAVSDLALAWYDQHQRAMPWRGQRDPYAIWISEVMLQQTQVDTVRPYYARWLARFPTVHALAVASEQDVLALWEGLGYYRRARQLHRAAQQVSQTGFPTTFEGWLALPGVGRYTAAALASLAFNQPVAVLDGNVKRVLARLFDVTLDVKSTAGERELWALAQTLLDPARPGDYNQAMMDLGATVCTPKTPRCTACPLTAHCLAYQRNTQAIRPVTAPRPPTPHHTLNAWVVERAGQVLLAQRPAGGLLGGLWQFPTAPADPLAGWPLQVTAPAPLITVQHAYTHFRVTVHAHRVRWLAGDPPPEPRTAWVDLADLPTYPMGKVDRRIARALLHPPAVAPSLPLV